MNSSVPRSSPALTKKSTISASMPSFSSALRSTGFLTVPLTSISILPRMAPHIVMGSTFSSTIFFGAKPLTARFTIRSEPTVEPEAEGKYSALPAMLLP